LPAAPDERATREALARIRAGDERGFDDLYRGQRDELLLLIRCRLGPELRAALESEDVFQSVALDAWRALPRFEERAPGSLRRFLRTLVVNKIRDRLDHVRAQKRAGSVPLSDSIAERAAARDELPGYSDPAYERLERAMARLDAGMREVVVMRRLEELSSREVAERLGTTDAAVRKLYSRALARLGVLLSQAEP
jgi:RNA polymerase sigma-70 factor (ECF subfamily)